MADFVHEDEGENQLQEILAIGETFLLGVLLWVFILYLILRCTVLKPKQMSKKKKGNMRQRRQNFGCWMKLLVSFIMVMCMCYFLILLKIGKPAETRLVHEEIKPQGEIYEKGLPSWFKSMDRFTNEEMNLTVCAVRCANWTLYDFERYMRIPHGVIPVPLLPIPALSPIGDQPAPEVQHQLIAYHPPAAEAATNSVEQNAQSEHEGTGNGVVEAPTGRDAVRSSSHRINEEADSLNVSVTATQSNQHYNEETTPNIATVTNNGSRDSNSPPTGLLVNPRQSEQEPHPPTALIATGGRSLDQEVVSNPKHPNYASFNRRLRSFNGWPKPQQQTPTELAEAGLYYTGVNNCTRCFFCGGGLRNWEQGEEPIIEHMIQFQGCPYVKELEKAGHVQAAKIRKEKREQKALAQRNASSSADQIQGAWNMNRTQRAHPASSDDEVQGAGYISLEQWEAILDNEPNWQDGEHNGQQFEAEHARFRDIQNQPGSSQLNIANGMNGTGGDNGTYIPIQASVTEDDYHPSAPEHILEGLGYSHNAVSHAVETVTSNGILVYTATDLGKVLFDEC